MESLSLEDPLLQSNLRVELLPEIKAVTVITDFTLYPFGEPAHVIITRNLPWISTIRMPNLRKLKLNISNFTSHCFRVQVMARAGTTLLLWRN